MDNTNNNSGFDGRRNYAPSPQQQAMYGYTQPPIGTGYPRHPMAVIPTSSSPPRAGYNVQQQYPTSNHLESPQMRGYMPGPPPIMGQAMQSPSYALPQTRYPQQTHLYQTQQAGQSLSQLMQQQQYQQPQQPQQYMHAQSLQAYQLDGAPGYPSPTMRQPSGNHQQMQATQQRPRQQHNPFHDVASSPTSSARPVSNTPSRPQPQVQVQVQVPARTPSQSQPQHRSSPQVQNPARTPSQAQQQLRRPSQSQPGSQQRPTPQGRSPHVVIETKRPQSHNQAIPVASQTPTSAARELPVDYQVLLLGLADQYINRAHGMSAFLTRNPQIADLDEYYELISAGLGCMESVLRNWKFSEPKAEARLQLRYANLLLEETDNDAELQELLIKGVALCERNRLVDLKYSMKHVQARSMFRTNPRAAFKMVDQMIETTEAYSHFSWMYAFRFLRVSLSLQLQRPDLVAALQQLRRISHQAGKQRQSPILATSSTLEALIHLRSGHSDSTEQFQTALAAARTHQLDPAVTAIPQLKLLLDCLDLCCDLINVKPDQLMVKMIVMQKTMDDGQKSTSWSADGTFCVPTAEAAPSDIAADTGGIMERSAEGKCALKFQWIRRSEMFALGYIFSTLASMNKNVVDGKAERYTKEGSKVTQDDFNPESERKVQSLNSASAHHDRRNFYHRLTLQLLVFAKCDRSEWQGAIEALAPLAEDIQPNEVDEHDFIQVMTLYLMGVVKQATGDLQGALKCFKSPALTLEAGQKEAGALRDLRLLSALNKILILKPRLECRGEVDSLIELVEPLCSGHTNSSFHSALNIIRASSTANLPILKMKNFLSLSANTAKRQSNQQMLCMTINLMTSTFFVDIMGDKAEMSAGVGRTLAERTKNPLWQAVANQMLANTLDFGGKRHEAGERRVEAMRSMERVPEQVKREFEMEM